MTKSHLPKGWEFLDPDALRPVLITVSVYLTAYEILRAAIVERLRDFYWVGFEGARDITNPKYETEVLALNRSPVHASLTWLKHHDAVDDTDIEAFLRVKDLRNRLAHDLLAYFNTDVQPDAFATSFAALTALLHKIELWWIREVEIPTTPDFDDVDVPDEEITPGRVLLVRLLTDIALGDEATSRRYADEMRRRHS